MKIKIKDLIRKLAKTGFFSIYLSSICSKVITLFGGVLIVRFLSKEDYGIYTLVLNAIAMLCIFGDFGASGATLQYAIEAEKNPKKQQGFFILGIKMSMASGVLSSLLILISPIFYPYQSETIRNLSILMFAIPIFTTSINYIGTVLRTKRENNKYSLYNVLMTFIHYISVIIATLLFGLKGSLISQYIYNAITLVIGYIIIKKFFTIKEYDKINKEEKKGFFKIAIGTQLNNTLSNFLYTIDIFILGIMNIQTIEISTYKVATVIPTALVFLPQCLSVYIFPYFVEHNNNVRWINEKIKEILKCIVPFYGLITLVGIALSRLIINILYGADYLQAVLPFSILMIGFFFNAAIKNFFGNIIYSFHKVKFSVFLNMLAIILNVIFNIIFVKIWGFTGVAISTAIIDIITAIISVIYLRKCIEQQEIVNKTLIEKGEKNEENNS